MSGEKHSTFPWSFFVSDHDTFVFLFILIFLFLISLNLISLIEQRIRRIRKNAQAASKFLGNAIRLPDS